MWPSSLVKRLGLAAALLVLGVVLLSVGYVGSFQIRDKLDSPNRTITGPLGSVTSASFSPDGKRLLTSSSDYYSGCDESFDLSKCKNHIVPDHGLQVWDPATGASIAALTGPDAVGKVVYAPDGTKFATVDKQGIKIWNATNNQVLRIITGSNGLGAFSSESQLIVDYGHVWSAATGKLVRKLSDDCNNGASFSPDGKHIATDSNYPHWQMMVCDSETGQVSFGLKDSNNAKGVSYFSDGKRLFAGGNGIYIWDANSGAVLKKFGDPRIHSTSLSADGKWLASVWFSDVEIWDANSYARIRRLYTPHDFPNLSFSPDGKRLVGFGHEYIEYWDLP